MTIHKSVILFLATLSLLAAGCGGGAASEPTVTVKLRGASAIAPAERRVANDGRIESDKTDLAPGTFSGTVTFDGAPPVVGQPSNFDPRSARTDKYCAANQSNVKDLTLVVDPRSKGVKNVFVYLVRKPKDVSLPPVPNTPVVFDQKNCTFLPHALIVRTGQPVLVKNSDQTSHNTHTNPRNAASSHYNNAISGGQTDRYTYAGAERLPVQVVCDIHGWMSAYQLPLDHPFAALTDKDGKFSIGGLPPGDYEFRVWHEKAGPLDSVNVFIQGGQTTEENLTFPASKFASFNGRAPRTVVVSANQ